MPRTPIALPSAVLIALLAAAPALAHMGPSPASPPPEPPKVQIRVQQVGEGAYCLYGRGGNIGVVVTPSATFMVDTQFESLAPAIQEEVRKLGPASIRYIVDTHYHPDHVGGNRFFSKGAEIIGHENVRTRLYEGPRWIAATYPGRIKEIESLLGSGKPIGPEYKTVLDGKLRLYRSSLEDARGFKPEEVVAPGVTYDGMLRLWLGDEEIQVYHVAPGHTDGDSIVYFPKRKVVHMGDLLVTGSYPFVDVDGGGATEGWLKNLDEVLSKIPPDTRVIPGHGESGGGAELKRLRAYLTDLRAAVVAAVKAGKSIEEAVRDIRLEAYADLKPGFMSLPQNVDQVWGEMGGRR